MIEYIGSASNSTVLMLEEHPSLPISRLVRSDCIADDNGVSGYHHRYVA
jgi:hypothetical protein